MFKLLILLTLHAAVYATGDPPPTTTTISPGTETVPDDADLPCPPGAKLFCWTCIQVGSEAECLDPNVGFWNECPGGGNKVNVCMFRFWKNTNGDVFMITRKCMNAVSCFQLIESLEPLCNITDGQADQEQQCVNCTQCEPEFCECCEPGVWSEWEDGDCSKSCGGGVLTRTRTCEDADGNRNQCANEPLECEGDSSETAACNEDPCIPKCVCHPDYAG